MIDFKWIYKIKEGKTKETVLGYKVGLLQMVYSNGGYNEIFSSVVKYTSIRILLSLVSQFNYKL